MASTLDRRLELHALLEEICDYVKFSPPTGFKLKYPCIVYERANNQTEYANGKPYIVETRYTVTVIDPDPDSEIVPKLEHFPKCTYDTHFISDNLNHDVFTIFY